MKPSDTIRKISDHLSAGRPRTAGCFGPPIAAMMAKTARAKNHPLYMCIVLHGILGRLPDGQANAER